MPSFQNLFDVSKKRVLVTGSSRGLGFRIARGFLERGAIVLLNGRSETQLRRAATALRHFANSVQECRFDVTSESEIRRAVREIERNGCIDVVVNNVGWQHRIRLDKVRLSVWQRVLASNLTSAMLVSREVAHGMIRRRAGKIINVCSLMSDFGRSTTGPYATAKGGLKMLTKAMCADWARYDIQVNAIGPGYFITNMTQALAKNRQFDAWVKRRTPAGRWGEPDELMGAVIFLSSDASSFVNGQIIYIDGGMSSVL